MIFSSIIHKICPGNNVTIYFEDKDIFNIFAFYNNIQNLLLSLDNNKTSEFKALNLNYDYIKQIDTSLFVVGYENNMSVIDEL